MSPEQAEGKRLDARSDIFSFGAVVYEMLTGQSAFRGNTVVATLTSVLRDEVRPLRELTQDVPEDLERIVHGCLKKDPEQRIQSMEDVKAALVLLKRQSDSGLIGHRSSTNLPAPPQVQQRRLGAPAMVGGAVLLAGLAGGGYWLMSRPGTPPARPQPPAAAATVAVAPQPGVLTNDNVVEMAGAQMTPSLMISQIRASKTDFNLSTTEVIRLTKAGVPEEVIAVMRDPLAIPAAAVTAAATVAPIPPVAPSVGAAQPGKGTSVSLGDGLIVHLALVDDIPAAVVEGDPVQFKVTEDVRVDDAVVIRKGASAAGFIVDAAKKKALVISGKITLRLDSVEAVDGQKIAIRATLPLHPGTISKRPVDSSAKKPGVASSAGTAYPGYVDGAKVVVVKTAAAGR
jgi:serine/threonine-protein kinase